MSDVPLIAIEEHWVLPAVTAATGALPPGERDESLVLNEHGDHLARLEDLGESRLATMDAQGIDVSLISHAPPGTQSLPGAEAVALAREANDVAADAVARHPDRLRALATLPLSAPGAAAGELERAAGLGHVGAMVHGRSRGRFLDDPVYDDAFATAARLGLPVFIHPQIPPDALRDVTTTDRLLFSTDYPFQQPTASDITAFLEELATDADRDAIRSGNAYRLFGLDGRPGRRPGPAFTPR